MEEKIDLKTGIYFNDKIYYCNDAIVLNVLKMFKKNDVVKFYLKTAKD